MGQTKEDRLAQQRLCKRRRYAEVKNDPELLAIAKENRRAQYLKAKEAKKIKSISEQPPREQKGQRKKWRENSKRYRQNKKEEKEVSPSYDEMNFVTRSSVKQKNILTLCPTEDLVQQKKQDTVAAIRQVRYAELRKRKRLLGTIEAYNRRDKARCRQIQRLKKLLDVQKKAQVDKARYNTPANIYIIIVK